MMSLILNEYGTTVFTTCHILKQLTKQVYKRVYCFEPSWDKKLAVLNAGGAERPEIQNVYHYNNCQ